MPIEKLDLEFPFWTIELVDKYDLYKLLNEMIDEINLLREEVDQLKNK